MKICYAYRRSNFYPYQGAEFPPASETALRRAYLEKVKAIGFDGIELPASLADNFTEVQLDELRSMLGDLDLTCAAVRGGGGLHNPRAAAGTRGRLEGAIQFAASMGAGILNTTVSTPQRDPEGPGRFVGEPHSQGSSRQASADDFERSSDGLREFADMAADLGIRISIEVHQHSIADCSWATLHLLDLIDRPNVGANPDLGNIYWTYDTPEESTEAAIVALATRSIYWHCKNLVRVHIPENRHSIFLRVPLPDGDLDYRFAMAAMLDAGFDGYLAVEGARQGDQLSSDARSLRYVREILAELG